MNTRLLLAALLLSTTLTQAADSPLKPLYPDITPTCACEDLAKVSIPNTTIDSAAIDPSDNSCRVTVTVTHPPANGRLKIWIGLPVKNWNGRFRGTGGGGFLGGHTNNLRGPVAQGFATGATDTGHEGGSGSFALDANNRLNWQSIIDNAYLGIHEMTVLGKKLTEKFYGKPPRYSYFVGGSTGGRQGLMEAQRYPQDYDGIISGCPAINWHRFLPSDLWPQVVMNDAKNYVSKAKLDAATAAAITACDETDSLKDGVIDNPLKCAYDPKQLIGQKFGDTEFTAADAEVIRKIWQGPRAPDGTFLWHGLAPGTDLNALAATGGSPLTGRPFGITMDYIRYYLVQDPKWDASTLTIAGFAQLWQQSVEQYGPILGADDPDLTAFRDHGGKIIITHGLADQLIPAEGTIDYYKRLQKQMGGAEKTTQFARLFISPGTDHGFRGPGPTPTGHDRAIINWVENNQPPDQLMGERRDKDNKLIGKRPLYPYPALTKYKGSGDPNAPENFISTTP